jgi:hypothetical protein
VSQDLFDAPWAEPFKAWSDQPFFEGESLSLAVLNQLATQEGVTNRRGFAVRFVGLPAHLFKLPAVGSVQAAEMRSHGAHCPADSAARYEQRIWQHGEILTRTTGDERWHDFFNAMVWLRFPRLKSCLNDFHVRSMVDSTNAVETMAMNEAADLPEPEAQTAHVSRAAPAVRRRGRLRDRVTLFDEGGALVLTRDRSLIEELAAFDWESLFVRRRQTFVSQLRVVLVGHALHQKLRNPYKSLCAQCVALDVAPDSDWPAVDAAASAALQDGQLLRRPFMPLPLLGIPGWCADNQDPAFYNDRRVFRPGRRVR